MRVTGNPDANTNPPHCQTSAPTVGPNNAWMGPSASKKKKIEMIIGLKIEMTDKLPQSQTMENRKARKNRAIHTMTSGIGIQETAMRI